MALPRLQLFEFTDLPWWPQTFRRLLTDFLRMLAELTTPFAPKYPLVVEALNASSSNRVVDLCSGGGGPWSSLHRDLEAALGSEIEVVLTDLFPDAAAAARFTDNDRVNFLREEVDARTAGAELRGARTLFDALHHFPPDQAQKILQQAVDNGESVIVFEILKRSITDLLPMLLTWIHVLLLTPLVRPFTWKRLALTYVVPVAPLVIAWDGSVSILRCYTPEELLQMAGKLKGGSGYEWHAGDYKRWKMFPVTYLVGFPSPRFPHRPSAGRTA